MRLLAKQVILLIFEVMSLLAHCLPYLRRGLGQAMDKLEGNLLLIYWT